MSPLSPRPTQIDSTLSPRSLEVFDERKQKISQAIKDYTMGNSDVGQFRLALAGHVTIDGHLERALRQHEAGDTVSYTTFGTLIFRQMNNLNGNAGYNRVDKISMNDPAQCDPAKAVRQF